jgi:class 3 adenylate cyclase/tetratricopeptide (TPR) repeat protein
MPSCAQCGEENPARAKFCLACGAGLSAAGGEARKTVTVLFTDLVGSTELGERLDPESVRRVVSQYFGEMRAVLERHGATIEKFIGDAIMAVFGIPAVHEDDALRAMRAAIEMRERLRVLNRDLERDWGVRLQVRTGVNTGEVIAGDPSLGQAFVSGDTVNVAARLEQNAAADQILIGTRTRELGEGAIESERIDALTAKGKAEPLQAWRLVAVRSDLATRYGVQRSPFIGRGDELRELEGVLDRAVDERCCLLVTVVGQPGIGKSRLVGEFTASSRLRARVVSGRCLPYGEGITYWPLVEIVNEVCGDDIEGTVRRLLGGYEASTVAARIAAAVGTAESPGSAAEIHWAFRKLFEGLAREQPLIICIDDIHWAEPTLLDLLEYVAGFASGAPLLVLCLARRELIDARPSWAVPRHNAILLSLQPISSGDAGQLIQQLAKNELQATAQERVAQAAEGNPLFIEQLLALNADVHPGNGAIQVPATMRALLSARIDLLHPGERAVIERASIEGRSFHRGAVVDLLDEPARAGAGPHLLSLLRKDFIQPDVPLFAEDDGFRFGHVLIRDAAYDTVPKQLRAQLHERFAAWLERAAGPRVADYEEILAYHLEQAYRNHAELGRNDEAARVAPIAGRRLASVGLRALDRGDMPAAIKLLGRATVVLPADDIQRLLVLSEFAGALADAGELPRAEAIANEALALAEPRGDQLALWRARVARLEVLTRTVAIGQANVLAQAEAAAAACERLGDDAGQARAWYVIGLMRSWRGVAAEADLALVNAIEHARRAGAHRQEAAALRWTLINAWFGPTTASAGSRLCHEVLGHTSAPSVEAVARIELGCFQALQGNFDEARAQFARGHAMLEDLGEHVLVAGSSQEHFDIEMLAGDPAAAELRLRQACDALERMGEKGFLTTRLGLLAQALYQQRRFLEAEAAAARAQALTDEPTDYDAQYRWRVVRAKVLAQRGDIDAAESLMHEALGLVEPTDWLNSRGHVHMDCAEMLELAGRASEALAHVEEAIHLFDAKENAVDAARARARLDELRAATAAERGAG